MTCITFIKVSDVTNENIRGSPTKVIDQACSEIGILHAIEAYDLFVVLVALHFIG